MKERIPPPPFREITHNQPEKVSSAFTNLNPKELRGELKGTIPEFAEIFDDLHSRLIQGGLGASLQNYPLSFLTNIQTASFLLRTGEFESTRFELQKGKLIQPWPSGNQGIDYRQLTITKEKYDKIGKTERSYSFTGTNANLNVMNMTSGDWKLVSQQVTQSYNEFVGEYNHDVKTRQLLEAGIDPSKPPITQ